MIHILFQIDSMTREVTTEYKIPIFTDVNVNDVNSLSQCLYHEKTL